MKAPVIRKLWLVLLWIGSATGVLADAALVFQTDFGLKDGAVAAMKGVAFGVNPQLRQFDLTHEIPPFNVWDAAHRLKQTVPYWPAGTVFVNVVDPGVGTERRAVVAKTKDGHYVVGPDNGALTFLAEAPGLAEVRVIDTERQRLPGSAASYTFHGRDVFAYVGAKLASGRLAFRDVGPRATNGPVRLPYQMPAFTNGILLGTVTVLDPNYGNVWSNLPRPLVEQAGLKPGVRVSYRFLQGGREVAAGEAPFATAFGEVKPGEPLVFLNSLLELAFALNQGDFAKKHGIGSGPDWTVEVKPLP